MYKLIENTQIVGKEIIFLPTCHSTNEMAATLSDLKKLSEGTVIITDNQTKGKGQRGNKKEFIR